jgi:hypothetical protein
VKIGSNISKNWQKNFSSLQKIVLFIKFTLKNFKKAVGYLTVFKRKLKIVKERKKCGY